VKGSGASDVLHKGAMENKLNLICDTGNFGSKKCKLLWWGLADFAFGWSLESGGLFYGGAFGRNLASVVVKIFSYLIQLAKKCYKICVFNAICRGNAAVTCITAQHKKGLFPSIWTGCTNLVFCIVYKPIA
jgi:hypothetical protein